jgi:PAS domain S-box-containing protein
MADNSSNLRASYLPLTWVAGGLAGVVGLFFVVQTLAELLPPAEAERMAQLFPLVALALSAAALLGGLAYVQTERRRMANHLDTQRELQACILRGIDALKRGQYQFTIPEGLKGERSVEALLDLRQRLEEVRHQEESRRRHIERLAHFSDVLRRHAQIESLAKELIRELAHAVEAGQGAIFVLEEARAGRFRLQGYYVSQAVDRIERELLSGEGLVGQALREKRTLVLTDVPEPFVTIESGLGEAAPRNLLLVPLVIEGQVVGLIELAAYQPFDAQAVTLVEELAGKAAVTIFNLQTAEQTARMLAESQALATELQERETRLLQTTDEIRRTQQALEASRSQLDAMMQNVPDAIFQLETQPNTGNQVFTFVSNRLLDLTGIEPDSLIQNPSLLRIHPDDRPAWDEQFAASAQTGQNVLWEGRITHRDGSMRWFRVSATPTTDNGCLRWNGTLSDITSTKEYEVSMRLRERAITSSSSGIVIADMRLPDQPITYVNPAFEQITGYSEAESVGRNCRFLQGTDRDQEALTQIRAALTEGRECQVLLRNYRKDGTLFWNELNLSPVRDEQGIVTHFVGVQNDVSERIENEQRIRQMNETLEIRVAERTAELQAAMDELRSAQHRIVQSEKLASLGQLVAGVAHEINTPLAAIKAGAENMSEFLPRALSDLPALLAGLEPDLRRRFQQLVDLSMNQNEQLSTRDERRIRKELEDRLKEAGIEDWRDMAKKLMLNGVRGDLDEFLPLLRLPQSKELIQTAYYVGQMKTNLDVIHQAAAKTRKTVYALKRYSHFQQEETLETVDLVDSMEVILTLYHNQLKHGIEVEKHYADLPPIKGYGDELGQVWTNIIHNAAQAMDYAGKLTIDIGRFENGGDAYVRITDSGPGIPPEIQDKIFEPFFTTKPQGEGTGLGLDICRKIIEKHRGTISVESQPGRTSFLITLPYRVAETEEA